MWYKAQVWLPGSIDCDAITRLSNEKEFLRYLCGLPSGSSVSLYAKNPDTEFVKESYSAIASFTINPATDQVRDAYVAGLGVAEQFLTPEQKDLVNQKIREISREDFPLPTIEELSDPNARVWHPEGVNNGNIQS